MKKNKGKKRKNKIRAGLLFLAVILLILTACATGSKKYNTFLDQQDIFAPLAPGGTVYLYIDVPKARAILNNIALPGMKGMDKKQADQILDKTNSAAAAYYPETAPRRFLAAAQGSYPSFQANISFTFSSAWKKQRSQTGDSYWYSAQDKLSVSLSPGRAFVSDGDPFVPAPGTRAPADFASFQHGAAVSGWIENAGGPINQFLDGLGLPIEIPAGQVLFGIYQSEGQREKYEARIRLETPSSSQTRALAVIISMARLFMPAPDPAAVEDPLAIAGVLFANSPEQDGVYLNLHTGLLSEKEISLLFNMFSVYSK